MGELYSQLPYIFFFFVSLNFIMLQYYVLLILLSGKHSQTAQVVSPGTRKLHNPTSPQMPEGLTG
jgi:hypothetical protein